MEKLLIIGCGGHCKSVIDIIEGQQKWNIIGLIGRKDEVGGKVFNHSIIGTDNDLSYLRKECKNSFVAIGQIGLDNLRKTLIQKLIKLDYAIPKLISKHSIVSSYSIIEMGCSVGHGALINAGAMIKSHTIINSNVTVEHDALIGSFCHLSPGVIINGGVTIGNNSFIGSGAIIREGIKIPPNTVISAGKRVMGWPLKEIKS